MLALNVPAVRKFGVKTMLKMTRAASATSEL
jgi:hypothetical protein